MAIHWEARKQIGFFKGFWESLKQSLFDPQRFFDGVPPTGGYESPLIFGIICLSFGMICSTLYQFAFQGLVFLFGLLTHQGAGELFLGTGLYLAIAVGAIVFSPIGSFIHLFLYSTIYHLFLWMVGGNKRGYEATFRAFAYSQGPQVLQIIPFLGSFATFIWQMVLMVIGFKKLHQASTGQAVAAALLPLVLICALTFLLIGGMVFLIVWIVSGGQIPHRI